MTKLVWTSELDTGIGVIDAQHKQIVEFINQLGEAKEHGDREAINEVIQGMVDYTLSHFAFEETLMEDSGYEFLRGHKKIHDLFVRRVGEFQTRFEAGDDITNELHNLLVRWLFNHIRNDDAAYVSAVRPKMVTIVEDKKEDGWLARSLGRFFGKK